MPEAYPGIVAKFRAMFARLRGTTSRHLPGQPRQFFDLEAKRQRQLAGDAHAFVDPAELGQFNTDMEQAFEEELAQQQKKAAP